MSKKGSVHGAACQRGSFSLYTCTCSKGRILANAFNLASGSQSCSISTDLPLMLGVCSARKAT